MLYGMYSVPISGQADSRESVPYKEKTTLPGTEADVSEIGCVAALDPEGPISASRFGNINPIPFRSKSGHVSHCEIAVCPTSERISPIP